MSYLMSRGLSGPEQCTTGEYWDDVVGECLCKAGLVPASLVGGGCVSPSGARAGGATAEASSYLPWLLGGALVLGGAYYLTRPKRARANPRRRRRRA